MLDSIVSYISKHFPKTAEQFQTTAIINSNLFSPFQIELPREVLNQSKQLIKEIYQLSETPQYMQAIEVPKNFENWPKTPSVLTCLDFHYSSEMGLKLIEINTNASLYIPFQIQKQALKDPTQFLDLSLLEKSFYKTFDLDRFPELSIFDEQPEKEGLYFEFLLYQEWLKKLGIKCNIISADNYEKLALKNIYNRHTDFYLEQISRQTQFKDYYENRRIFSPNPKGYFLFADKKRLNVFRRLLKENGSQNYEMIPETLQFKDFENQDELWKKRKQYFFKPDQSFGSKGAFAGKSISKKAFAALYSPEFIAQEYCPAGRQTFKHSGEDIEMKYDLRLYCFEGTLQSYGARIYQGQTTNMKTPLGGLAPLHFV